VYALCVAVWNSGCRPKVTICLARFTRTCKVQQARNLFTLALMPKQYTTYLNKKFEIMLQDARKPIAVPVRKLSVYLQPFRRDFYGSTALWCSRAQVFLNLENRDLNRRNLRSMLKISHAACPCLSQLVSAQFALAMCLAAWNRQKKSTKPPILAFKVIHGHWIGRQSRASVRLPISD